MVLDLLANIVFSIIALLQGTLVFSVPVFVITVVAAFFGAKLQKKYELSWLQAVLSIIFIVVAVIVFAIYLYPAVTTLGQETLGIAGDVYAPNITGLIGMAILNPIRLLVVSLIISLLLLPLGFVGQFVYEKFLTKMNFYVRVFAAVFAAVLLAWILILFVIPGLLNLDVLTGVFYLIFYGFAY